GALHTMSMFHYRRFLSDAMREEATPMAGGQAVAELEAKYRDDVTLRAKIEEAKLEEARMATAMPLQFAKPLELEARRRLELRGEGEAMPGAKAEDYARGLLAAPHLPFADHEALGRRIRIEQEMHRAATERGLQVPGRPE